MDLPLISVRVVNVDWYLSEETKLPVVRIFGCTPAGQRSCLHLHGALPYFMVRPMEDEQTGVSAQFEDPDSLRALLPDLEQSIEAAMSVSAGRPSGSPTSTHEKGESWTPSGMRRKQQRVLAQLEVVRGVPFYGYNGDEALFVKVYLNNPALTGKVASVLQAGHVMSTRFQPYESHVPFLLQVFIDYNISGMSYVHLKNALFLLPLPERSSVPASKLFSQDSEGADDAARPGLFLASLVSPDLLARPPDQAARTAVFPGAESTFQGVAGDPSKSESLRLGFSPQEDTSANAVRQADEGAQDLLAGISMSQLFSQPEPSPESPRSGAGGAPRPEAKSPAAPAEDAGRDPQKRPPASWWERQSTAELEVAGTVSDIINPSLLAAGKSGAKGKGIAVASLRELWDEERERARVAGGGSQLSAPPGLELAGSQDTWTPPDGLLTQDLAGAVNDLTRNVFRRCSSVPEGLDDRPAPSSPKEGQEPEPGLSPLAHPSQPPGPVLSQGSGDVASVSESVGNYLSAPDVRATSEGDNALVDMLAALRSSQSQPDEEGSRTLSPRWRKSSSLEASVPEDPLATHTSLIGQADSITATQRRQELEEEDLSQRMAHAADAEVQYESDGSDEFKDDRDGGIAAMGAPPSPPGSSLPVVSTPATAATPARRDMPWTQRAGTIPPWSPRNARLSGALAARLASWHGESGMDADRCLKGDAVGERGLAGKGGRDEEEAAGRERGHAREASDELLPSQVSSRGLEELEDSVRTKLDAEGSPASARNGSHLPGDPPGDKGMGHSAGELVDIICSQVELERDDAGELDSGTSDMGGSRRGGADGEGSPRSDSREGSGEEFGGDGPDAGEYRAGDGGRERGPIEIQYDNSEDGEDLESIFESELAAAGDTDVEDVGEGAEDGSASDGGPLRLRGGVGLSRSRAKVPRSAAPAGGPTAVDPEPNAADGPAEDRADRGTLGSQQRNARRVRGGGVGSGRSTLGFRGFRPPRTAKGRDGNSDSDQGHLGAGTDLRRSDSVANPEYHEESRADNNGEEEEEEEEEERSQVVIPGWGSQGHHPVEYSGSQLNFVSPSRLRHSPNLARCRQVDTDGEAVSRLETPQKRKKLFGGEGRSESTEGSIPGRAAAGCSSRDDSQAMEAKPSREPSTSEGERNRPQEPNSPGRRPSESSSRCVGDSRRSTVVTSEVQSGLLPQGGYTPSGVPDTGDEIKDVKSRWQRADERLRLAQARATRPRPPRRPRRKKVGEKEKGHRDSGIGPDEKGHRTKEAPSDAEVAARSDPAAPPAADAARERPQLDGLSSPTSQHPRGKVPNTTTTTMTASMAALESVSASATSPPRGDSLEGADAHGSPEVQRQDQHSVGFHEEGEPGTPIPGVVGEDANIADVLNLEDAKDSVREAAVPSIVASPTTDGSHRDARRSLGHSAKTTPMKRREGRSSTSSHQGGVEASEEKPPDASTSLDPVLAVESSKRKRDSDVTPGNSGALGTPKHREYTLASVSSPPSPVPSRNSPLVAVDNWLRSPSLQLSAHSDQSDTVPLAQRTPAPRARRGATPAKPSTSDERRENEGRGGIGSLSESLEMPLTVGSDSAGSTSQRCGLLGSAPLSPGRHRDSRGSRALLLRPRESAPDPSESAVALERLGLPQVVHTEPYYSRKDDVPERPREFAGKVFRIPHKDDLEEFDTLPSRELLYANDERAPERTAQQQPGPAAPNSQEPAVSPRSEPSDGEFPARTRAASAGHAEGTDASSAMTGAGEATHAAGRHGVGTLPSGSKRREVGPAPLYRARPTSATEEAKGAADRGLFRGAGGSRRPKILQLVPVSSPPTYKAAVAWAKAHPPTRDGRERSAVDLLDTPALRSTRNALGVLAGGGEADLVDGTAEMSMVADANTGQLVPAPAARPASVPIAGSTRGGVSQSSSAGEGEHSPGTSVSISFSREEASRRGDRLSDFSTRRAKRPTQAPHRASTKSQISPNTQTPSTCPSEEAGAFAFDLGKKRAAGSTAAATKAPNPKPMEVNRKHGTARGDDESPTAAEDGGLGNFGLSGGFVGRDERRGYAGDRLTVMSIEIHVQVGSDRRPDPRQDPVHGICWRVKDSFTSSDEELVETMSGAIVLPIPFRGGSARRSGGAGKGKPGVGGQAGTPTGKGAGIGAEPGEARAPPGDTCLKCGAHRSEERAGSFCTFEGGGFLGQILRGGDPGKSAERLPEAKSVDKAADGETRGQRGRFTFRHGFGRGVEVVEVCSEAQLFQALVATFCRHDPDFVVGWEIQGDSLGYIIERGFQMNPSVDMTRLLSRTPGREADRRNAGDEWGKTHGSGIWLTGRTVLNMWRLMRSELKLCSYTLQSVAEHVLRRRIPSFSYHLRSKWFSGRSVAGRSRALSEPLDRAAACLAILDKLDLIGRTSEMARLFGIDFFSVLSRGSQYRVEAVMLRVLKPQNYVAVSPSRQQVARQAAMESIPLVFEPHSRLYTSPVVVLDFQSLYPSMIIAYNLCYSTCLGKFDPRTAGTSGRLGVLTYPEAKTGEALARAADAHKAWVSSQARGSDGCESGGRARACRDGVGEGSDTSRFRSGSAGDASEASPAEGCRRKSSPEGGRQGAGPEREGPSFRGGTSQEDLFDIGKGDEGSETRGRVPLGGRRNWDPRCIHMAPNTAGFCHPSLRQGILPLMLREILETRVMIKGAMKRAEEAGQRVLARTLNARQFALKMISNVTYGYTAAGYSGRMPMAELADAIVESARQSLIAAARLVDNHETWKASVVYGDTDSLFIELPGRSLEEAHRIGREMASAVTRSCPPDVVLKFEKVYLPCILASKKRYVGFMYESPKDLKPSFDAKGIETVRRDGCPLVVKMLEKVLRILFTTKDLSQVKGYLYRQWTRILTDRASVGDFIFAKEVKLGTYASDVYMPPSAIVASKAMASDPRAEPKYCERVPYVVVAGPVGARLMDLVVSPEQLLAEGSGLRLNGKYYITKVINPALDRALALVGVDVASWYNDMPRPAPRVIPKSWKSTAEGSAPGPRRQAENDAGGGFGDEHRIYGNGSGSGGVVKKRRGGRDAEGAGARASVITNFFVSDRCSLCGDHCARSVCGRCAREPATRCVALSRLRDSDLGAQQLLEMCRQCTGHAPTELFGTESCGSLDCPVYFERHRALLRGREARELCDALGLLSA